MDNQSMAGLSDSDVVERFATYSPSFVRLDTEPDSDHSASEEFHQDADGVWRRSVDTALGQAVVTIGGALHYDLALENNARVGDAYQFRSSFKHIKGTFDASDLSIASFTSVVDDKYPSLALAQGVMKSGRYANARSEYLEAIRYAGIDCIAAAHPRNLSLGVAGVLATEAAARARGVVLSGLGRESAPVYEVNGILVAVLSYTLDIRDRDARITSDGAAALLSEYSPERVAADVETVRSRGAGVIIGMLNCQGVAAPHDIDARRIAGMTMAELGVDYVACNRPGTVSEYERYRTEDEREVPLATSLGTLMSGASREAGYASVLLRLTLRPTVDGSVDIEDAFIPVLRLPYYEGAATPAIPLPAGSRAFREHDRAGAVAGQITKLLGDGIAHHEQRRVTVFSHYQPHFTPNTLAELLGVEFSDADQAVLGSRADKPLNRIATRLEDIAKGCAVVLGARTRGAKIQHRITPETAREVNARVAIAPEPIAGIPTLVVEDPWAAAMAAGRDILDRYDPTVVAVTGTAGKTTTKDLIGLCLSAGMKTLHIRGNGNTATTIHTSIQKLRATDEAFVQEVHEGTPKAAGLMSELLRPRIAVITSIADGHLDQMGTLENVIEGNTDIVNGMPADGVLIVNNDNEYLRELTFPVRTLRYGVDDPACDVYARDVELSESHSSFTIVDGDTVLDAWLGVSGVHNVSNALAAYLAAREAGVPPHRIIGALSTYRANSVRQNLVEHGGYQLLVDTYNSNLLALGVSLDMLSRVEIVPHARRIAVLGDMGEQGDKFHENHVEAGVKVAELGVDILLCHGDGMRLAAETARAAGVTTMHEGNLEDFLARVRDTLRPGDAVLFKAAGAANFTERVVVPLFGKIV
ncbi:Mur ligase family protein [Microbacterium halophytorum]|uniref:Mur ligase family protein n=1 Tax=Microbacterium halophytorum TaxID=2067568 RepID=UPI000CFE0450|nr:Mur ligase family protein [Microbacterium halophytorum]